MSVRHRSAPRRVRGAAGALLAAGLAGSLGLVSSVAAQPPPRVTALNARDADRAGRAIAVVPRMFGSQALLEVRAAAIAPTLSPLDANGTADAGEASRRDAMGLLAVADDGSVAIADDIGDPSGGLTLADAHGDQLHLAVHGAAGAAFAPSGGWLALVDAAGALWRVDTASGSASPIADGPFAGAVAFRADGALLTVSLPSAEAPYAAGLVSVDPESGRSRPVEGTREPDLVLAARELADGAIAVVAHRPGAGVLLLRVEDGRSVLLASLDPEATDPSISEDGTVVAYALASGGSYLVRSNGDGVRPLGNGAVPRIAPDGRAVAVLRDGETVVVDDAGHVLDRLRSPLARWAVCGGCAS